MSISIVNRRATLEEIRKSIREAPLNAIRELLTDQQILEACKTCGHQFRNRLYGPVVTVLHFLAQAIGRESSFISTWQELFTPLLADFPEMSLDSYVPSGLTHARKRLPREVLELLAFETCTKTKELALPTWQGLRLLAIDGSAVSMPREPELFEHFGRHKARKTTVRYPLGTFVTLLNVSSSLILDYNFGAFDPGEDKTARPLLQHLGSGDLLLADRGFSGSPTLSRVRTQGADFLMRKHARLIVGNLPVIKRLGKDDFITEIPMSKPARKQDPTLPQKVRTRIFRYTWTTPANETVTEWFVTSLENSKRFNKKKLALLYHQRWQIEISYLEFKQHFHADILRSKTVNNIYKEFAAHILAYQLVRLLMQAAAQKHNKTATKISFLNAARWVISFSHRMSAATPWQLPFLYQRLLDAIASSTIDIRPGRLEPRMITRETKHWPRLKTSRSKWRKQRLKETA